MNQTFKQAIVFILWTSFLYIGYQLTNRYQFFEPQYIYKVPFEDNIPFLVWTVIPYFLLIDLMYLPIFLKDHKLFYQSLKAITIGVLINYSVFFFFPTIIERPNPPTGNSFSEMLYLKLLSIDTPANCFPSGHITSPFIACYFFCQNYPKAKGIIFLVFFLLALSVLTTKQHYLIDILAGLITAIIGIYFSNHIKLKR